MGYFFLSEYTKQFLCSIIVINYISLLYLSFSVLVESGTVISFVGFINSGYCNIYRNVVGLMSLRLNKMVSFNLFVDLIINYSSG